MELTATFKWRKWLALALLAVFAGAATWVSMTHGPGLTNDSVHYLRNAESIVGGTGIRFKAASYGPGFPYLIAAGEYLGLSGAMAVQIINSVAAAGAVVLGFVLLTRHVSARWLVWGATVLVAVSPTLLGVSRMAWSEPVFLLLILGLILAVEQVGRKPTSKLWLASVVLLLWAAFLVRFAGMCLLFAAPLSILLMLRKHGWRRAWTSALVVGAAACVVPLLWMWRNQALTGMVLGPRPPAIETPLNVIKLTMRTVGHWVVPFDAPTGVAVGIGLLFWLTVVAAVIAVWRASNQLTGVSYSGIPLVVVSAVYVGYMMASQLSTGLDPINDRLLVPVYIPLIVLLAAGVDRFIGWLPRGKNTASIIVGVALALLIVGHGVALAQVVRTSATNGVGYASKQWVESPLVHAVAQLPPSATVYTNRPGGVRAVTGRADIYDAPVYTHYRSDKPAGSLAGFRDSVGCQPDPYLAWFNEKDPRWFTPQQISQVLTLTVVATYSDGTLYRMTTQPTPASQCAPRRPQ